jgi:methylated-DNA-protein-cysteine methyltransferase related protein
MQNNQEGTASRAYQRNRNLDTAEKNRLTILQIFSPSTLFLIVSSYTAIYKVVRQIPYGKVATYGQVAELADLPRRARLVGYALFRVDTNSDVPWHRVINAKGEISESPFRQGGDYLQRSRLEAERIEFSPQGKINLQRHQWRS